MGINSLNFLTGALKDDLKTKDADGFVLEANKKTGSKNLFEGAETVYNRNGGDTVDFTNEKYYANGNTILMYDQKGGRVSYTNTDTGKTEWKSISELAPSLKGKDIKFAEDELYSFSNPVDLVTKPKDGKFGVSGEDIRTILENAKKEGISQKDAVKEFLIGKYGSSSTDVLQKLMGKEFNTTSGQEFLQEYRDQAFDNLAGKLSQKMSKVAEQAVDNKDIVVNNYKGFNFNFNSDITDPKEKLMYQEAVKIDKDLFAQNKDGYADKLVAYTKQIFPDSAGKITADKISIDVKGNTNIASSEDVNQGSVNLDSCYHGGPKVTLTEDQTQQLMDAFNKNDKAAFDSIVRAAGAIDCHTGKGLDAGADSLQYADKSGDYWNAMLKLQEEGKLATQNSTSSKDNKDGIGLNVSTNVNPATVTLRWDPMKFEDKNNEYTFVDDEDGDGQFDGKSELMGYDKNWADMVKFDTDGDGIISGSELDKVSVLKTNKNTGKTEFISARKAGLSEINVASHVDKNEKLNEDQDLIGNFMVKMMDGTDIQAEQTNDSQSWLDKFVDNIKKGLGV